MRFAYADPPYLGCAEKLYGNAAYDDPETHRALIALLEDEYPDGWALSLSTPSITTLAPMMPNDVRWGAWTKTFCSFKPGVNPAYAWETVVFRGGRKKRSRKEDTVRDWHAEPMTLRRGLAGAKPPGFAAWIVQLLGARVQYGDTIDDLFPGTGAMLGVWRMPNGTHVAAAQPVGEPNR
jgi:hypothetical protein